MKYIDMSFDEENLSFVHKRLVQGKDKCEIFLKQREFHLDVKPQKFSQMEQKAKEETPQYNIISNDVWYHVSKHIPPDHVQTFALICRQTAALVRTKSFWKHLFLKYCQKFDQNVWILHLPAHLQLDNIRHLSSPIFRSSVIEALFQSYAPLTKRLNSYNIDLLIGRTYISAWHKLWDDCMWFVCYQFKQSVRPKSISENSSRKSVFTINKEIVNDWESLANSEFEDNEQSEDDDDGEGNSSLFTNDEGPYEGVCLLLIFGPRFIPFPAELSYGANASCNKLRLSAIRRLLTSDMREYNLELDFVNPFNKDITTIRYPTAKHLVIPWWHPEFKKCIKFEAHDKFS